MTIQETTLDTAVAASLNALPLHDVFAGRAVQSLQPAAGVRVCCERATSEPYGPQGPTRGDEFPDPTLPPDSRAG